MLLGITQNMMIVSFEPFFDYSIFMIFESNHLLYAKVIYLFILFPLFIFLRSFIIIKLAH